MSDKFLNTGGSGNTDISNGTINAYLASLTVASLRPSMPLKTNSVNTLVSTKLDIADVNNLENRLDSIITNPYVGDFKASDFETDDYFSVNDELQKIDNLQASTQSPDITNITGLTKTTELATSRIYDTSQTVSIDLTNDTVDIVAPNLLHNGVVIGGGGGSLQDAYVNSGTNPGDATIEIDNTRYGLTLKNTTGADSNTQFLIQNSAGDPKFSISGAGVVDTFDATINCGDILIDSNSKQLKISNTDTSYAQYTNNGMTFRDTSGVDNTINATTAGINLDVGDNTDSFTFTTSTNQWASIDATALTLNSGRIKTIGNSITIGRLNSNTETGASNIIMGVEAGSLLTTGGSNIGLGFNTLRDVSTGNNNIALGQSASLLNVSRDDTIAIGFGALLNNATSNTVAIGRDALYDNVSGLGCIGIGYKALTRNTAANNVALGEQALASNISGTNNTAVGFEASQFTTGANNTSLGKNALKGVVGVSTAVGNTAVGSGSSFSNRSGSNNVSIGINSLYTNQAGANNVAIGFQSMYFNTAADNTAVGYSALQNNSSGAGNTAIGKFSLYSQNTNSYSTAIGSEASTYAAGAYNTSLGYQALKAANGSLGAGNTSIGSLTMGVNSSGADNVAVGKSALAANTTGASNTAVGGSALATNAGSSNSTAVGFEAAKFTTGANNTVVGFNAMLGVSGASTGSDNTAIGYQAGLDITTALKSTFIGHRAGHIKTTGDGCVGVGWSAGGLDTTGTYNTAIGYGATSLGTGGSNTNRISIGQNAQCDTDNTCTIQTSVIRAVSPNLCDLGTDTARFKDLHLNGTAYAGGVALTSDRKLKENITPSSERLDKLNLIPVVDFNFIATPDVPHTGFIAQDIEEIFPTFIKETDDEDGGKTKHIDYMKLIPVLVKSIQELSARVVALEGI